MTAAADAVLGVRLDRRLRRIPAGAWVGRLAERAWAWDLADQATREWWPQGITWCGERLLVSWYAKSGGSRVSIVDLAARRYAHVTLLRPDGSPLAVHAGGLAYAAPWVHVAATGKGFWSLHPDDLDPAARTWRARTLHTPPAPSGGPLRWSFLDAVRTSSQAEMHGGRAASASERRRDPATDAETRWRRTSSEAKMKPGPLAVEEIAQPGPSAVEEIAQPGPSAVEEIAQPGPSAVEEVAQQPSRDPDSPTHLVAGEYGRGTKSRRLWRLPLTHGLPAGDVQLLGEGPPGMQGVVDLGDRLLVSTSHGPWTRGTLWTLPAAAIAGRAATSAGDARASTPQRRGLPVGPEDLATDDEGCVWLAGEHPHRRVVVRLEHK